MSEVDIGGCRGSHVSSLSVRVVGVAALASVRNVRIHRDERRLGGCAELPRGVRTVSVPQAMFPVSDASRSG